jgi:hypothetical protein
MQCPLFGPRRSLTIVTWLLALTILIVVPSPQKAADDRQPLTQKDLEKIVTEAIKEKVLDLDTDTYEVHDGLLEYNVYTGINGQSSHDKHDLAILYPLAWEFTVQLLKPVKGDEKEWNEVWEKPVAAIREVEQKQLNIIQAYGTKDADRMRSRLDLLNAVAFETMIEAYEALARKKKVIAEVRNGDVIPDSLTVRLLLKPDDADNPPAVYCLPTFFYRRAKQAGKLEWGSALSVRKADSGRQTKVPAGDYYFRAVWPDGSTSEDVKVSVSQSNVEVSLPRSKK